MKEEKDPRIEIDENDSYNEESWEEMIDSDAMNNGDDGLMRGYLEDWLFINATNFGYVETLIK